MDFKDIVGQEHIISHLRTAIAKGTVNHAYMIEGEENSGKLMIAEAFAKTLLCEENLTDSKGKYSCNRCKACIQVESKNHPDVVYVTHEKASIGVEDIRIQVNSDIVIKPYSSSKKIYIIDDAWKMTDGAQNALLKTIEEPPEYAVILLLTNNRNALLQTIQSRCVHLSLWPVHEEKIKQFLMEKYQIPDYLAKLAASFAGGNVGKAIQFATSNEFEKTKESVVRMVSAISDMKTYEVIEIVKEWKEDKQNITDYLDLCMLWFRDVLLYKSTGNRDAILFQEDIVAIKKQADRMDYDKIDTIFQSIEQTKQRLKANVNFEIAIEMMMLTIKENEHG